MPRTTSKPIAVKVPKPKRGRPKGVTADRKSYGPLGDLLRSRRAALRLGLLDVAKACGCSVQFISNIEHGRAPLPWDKAQTLADCLQIPLEELHAANLSVRFEFRSFLGEKAAARSAEPQNAASLFAMAVKDRKLRQILERYASATPGNRRKFHQAATKALT
nr:Helix-turn-helix domain protein [uncultured bacterium]